MDPGNRFEVKEEVNRDFKGFLLKITRIISLITVEPIVICYLVAQVLSSLAIQNFYLEKACRVSLGFEKHVCDALARRDTANYTLQEEEVQKVVAALTGWKSILHSFLPCALLLFFGGYSDKYGKRKMFLLIPTAGEILASIGIIINIYFFYELPIEVAAVTETIFPGLAGGFTTLSMAAFSYIADVTTEEERTLRIGFVNISYFVGSIIGATFSGILVKNFSFYGVFLACTGAYIACFVYTFFRIKEVKKIDQSVEPTNNYCQWLRNFFDINHVKETLTVAFKSGHNKRRLRIILLLIVMCLLIGQVLGETSVMYLFTRYQFNWDELAYSIFYTYAMCTALLGALCCVGIFSRLLKFNDAVIGVISCSSKILSSFVYAFATKTWHIYIAPLIDIFSKASFIVARSIVTKIVPNNDLGKVNSCFGLAEAMMPLVYTPMYTAIYTATINTLPGAFFLVSAALISPAVVIFLWLYFYNKRITKINVSAEPPEQIEEIKGAQI